MRKCRNWQTSKTKDLVIIAIVWVQVPSSALNNKTGIKQSVWSLSYCSKPKRALNPWFKVSPPARSLQNRRPPGRLATRLPQGFGYCVAGAPWVQGLRSASVGAEQTSPGCLAVFAPLRSAQNRRPPDVLQPIFRKATVVVARVLHGSRSPLCTPSSALKWGKLNYTDFVQNCILDQKERTSL